MSRRIPPTSMHVCVCVSTSTSSAHARTTTRDHETSAYATPGQYKEMVNVEHCVKGNVTKLTQRPDRGDKRIRERVVELCLFCPRLVSRAGSFCVLLRTRISRERERESENFANSEIGLNKLLGRHFHPGLKKKKRIKRLSDAFAKPSWTSSASTCTRTVEGQDA